MNYQNRIESLERQVRRFQLALAIAFITCSVLAVVGFKQDVKTVDKVVARSVQIVDSSGNVVVKLNAKGVGLGQIVVWNQDATHAFVARDPVRTCLANRMTISNAAIANRITKKLSYEELIKGGVTNQNLPDLLGMPICPNGGEYTLEKGKETFRVRCSVESHGTFEPGVDKS